MCLVCCRVGTVSPWRDEDEFRQACEELEQVCVSCVCMCTEFVNTMCALCLLHSRMLPCFIPSLMTTMMTCLVSL